MTANPATGAWGAGLATIAADGRVLEAFFREPRLGTDAPIAPDDLVTEERQD